MECDCKAQNYSEIRSAVQELFGLFLDGLRESGKSQKTNGKKAKVRFANRTLSSIQLGILDFFKNQRAVGAAEAERVA
ncbi:hypothetical protein SAMN05660772_00744 [Pasteurella testudinis DSM 23072]|uniref:Uncharacterized protein n=1 Tax=Pasteurella testudinis DSM 23072 TaxID=1122938 RepID=A0A1W1USB5_9PAST|nr:hypothetical protein SAMN05660772_00744 [Pasteurella testudinis DSM 23072]SUB50934.1 Uncharacterised protein [Pasteurella testudinis]